MHYFLPHLSFVLNYVHTNICTYVRTYSFIEKFSNANLDLKQITQYSDYEKSERDKNVCSEN